MVFSKRIIEYAFSLFTFNLSEKKRRILHSGIICFVLFLCRGNPFIVKAFQILYNFVNTLRDIIGEAEKRTISTNLLSTQQAERAFQTIALTSRDLFSLAISLNNTILAGF